MRVCMIACVKDYVCAPLCLGTPTLLRCRGVQDQQIVEEEEEEKADLGGLSGDSSSDIKKYCTNFVLKLKNVELCSAKDCSRSWD